MNPYLIGISVVVVAALIVFGGFQIFNRPEVPPKPEGVAVEETTEGEAPAESAPPPVIEEIEEEVSASPPPPPAPASAPAPSPPPPPPPEPVIASFTIEADDNGFYIDGEDINSVSVSGGSEVSILFQVRKGGVYFGGLDFRGCGAETSRVDPGESTTVAFTADASCTITSYWPASNTKKDSVGIIVE